MTFDPEYHVDAAIIVDIVTNCDEQGQPFIQFSYYSIKLEWKKKA